MLGQLGYQNINELISQTVPEKILFKGELNIGEPNSEYEALRILKGLSRQYINTAKKFNAGLVDQRQVDNIHDLTTKTAELITQLNKGGGRLVNAGNIIVRQESDAIKQVSKLIDQNRFKLSKKELAQLHKKVAQVD